MEWMSRHEYSVYQSIFPPENIAAAFRAKETAAAWGRNGSPGVTVLTGYPNYPTGKLFPGYANSLLSEDAAFSDPGVRVLRSKLSVKDNVNFVNRLWNALSFLFSGMWNVLFRIKKRIPRPEVVVASSGPVFAGLLGWIAAKKFHCLWSLNSGYYLQTVIGHGEERPVPIVYGDAGPGAFPVQTGEKGRGGHPGIQNDPV